MNEDVKKIIKLVTVCLPFFVWLAMLWTTFMMIDLDASMGFEYNVMNVLMAHGTMLVGTVSLIFLVVWTKSFDEWYGKNFQ